MATKTVEIDDIGAVNLYKRRGSTNIRISISSTGKVRVTIPSWLPFRAGVEYAKAKKEWIRTHLKPGQIITHATPLGKSHHYEFIASNKSRISTRVTTGIIRITYPESLSISDPKVQDAASKAGIRALRFEAERFLPPRLKQLANEYDFSYRSVSIKALKGRWGSCTHQKDIVLNMYLMQLPWELIDYVILHELTHTRIMAHGRPFWNEMAKYVPHLPRIRKAMRAHQPVI